jgi:triosephosphate isomerase (TIM)
MRRLLIAGNWKMNGLPADGAELARGLAKALVDMPAVDVAVFPPFLSIPGVVAALKGTSVVVGGQDLHPAAKGAHTGNTSGEMLKAAGCGSVLVGHSERRSFEKESGEYLAQKTRAGLRAGLQVVFCVGESLDEREGNRTLDVVRGQLADGLVGLTSSELDRIVIAYEPVWAIGTGKVATPDQAQDVHAAIRAWVGSTWDAGTARSMRILYGGSVKPGNAAGILSQPDIDGALVGGASLKADSFDGIVRAQSNGD